MLEYRAETDVAFADHMKHAPAKAKYMSPIIQNEIIDLIAAHVRSRVVEACNNAPCFTVLADETTDRSVREQVSLSVRFLEKRQEGIHTVAFSLFLCV